MEKYELIDIANDTLKIIKKHKKYKFNNTEIDISQDLSYSKINSILYKPNDDIEIRTNKGKFSNIEFTQSTTIDQIISKTILDGNIPNKHIGCLNFASARHPGGGFFGGSRAQEESLCRSSGLYPCIEQFHEMYDYNKKLNGLYSDYIIYSPHVPFFKNDNGKLTNLCWSSVITSPAVNTTNVKHNISVIPLTMIVRIRKILTVAINNDVDVLILGAFGCGVFKNNPNDVAIYFKHWLIDNNYKQYFDNVIFAIPDNNMYNIFKNIIK